jgi:hypothetical protein
LLALATLKPECRGKLVKVKRGKHPTLVVRGIKLSFRITRESDLTFRIRTKVGRLVSTWRTHSARASDEPTCRSTCSPASAA